MAKTLDPSATHLVEEEESYFVSMTDMMVGVIFIFVILLMTFALDFQEAEEVREESVAKLEAAEKAKEAILNEIKESLERQGVQVEIDTQNGVLHLPEEILFASGSATLNAQGRQSLAHLARALYSVVPCYAQKPDDYGLDCDTVSNAKLDAVFVEGHTDDVPIGANSPFDDNWDLSAQRAISTYKQLIDIQPELDTLETVTRVDRGGQKLFSVSGYGEFRPRQSNSTEEGRQSNRRIDLRFLMKTPRSGDLAVAEQRVNEAASQNEP